jgi:tRNA-dihydrouridine synthase A
MVAAVGVPVTVKCRIGVDEQEPREALFALVDAVAKAGAAGVIAHARKAWLEGLSPKDNRTVPPLDYPLVYELKAAHPDLPIAINGGIASLAAANVHLEHVDGVMIGRAAYQNPELLLNVDPWIFGQAAPFADSFAALEAYESYIAGELEKGVRLADMTRHILGLFAGRPGARLYRQRLSTMAPRAGAGLAALREAVAAVSREGQVAAE